MVRLIAQFSGFLGRNHDGEPGVKTPWLVLREINAFVCGIRFARKKEGLVYGHSHIVFFTHVRKTTRSGGGLLVDREARAL